MNRKGVSRTVLGIVMLLVVVVAVGLVGGLYYFAVAPRVCPSGYQWDTVTRTCIKITYDGEWGDAFLPTKGNFANSFAQGTDCNVTADVLGGNWENCIFESITALNATAHPTMSDHDLTFSLALKITGGDVGPDTSFEIDTGAGTSSTGVPADDVPLVLAKLYTHTDDPQLVVDMSGGIDDQEDLDYKYGPLAKDEYVLVIKWHTLTISPDFTDGDDIARLTIELDTTEDADTAQITVESA